MPIFNAETKDQAANRIADSIQKDSAFLLRTIRDIYNRNMIELWSDLELAKLVMDRLDTKAADVFTLSGSLKAIANAAQPGSITVGVPDTVDVFGNTDGTVSIAPKG